MGSRPLALSAQWRRFPHPTARHGGRLLLVQRHLWVEDRDTGDTTPRAWNWQTTNGSPFDQFLITWISLPSPSVVSGSITAQNTSELRWPLADASPDGGFQIERQVGNAAWIQIGNVAANTSDSDGFLSFVDRALALGQLHRYRVRYVFGGRKSAPSNVVTLDGWLA